MNLDINGLPYMRVGDITVGTATTSVSFTGLTISKDDDYMLVSDVYNPTGSNNDIFMHINGNTTLTNYYRQYLYCDGTSVTADRTNNNASIYIPATRKSVGITNIKLTNSGYYITKTKAGVSYDSVAIALEEVCTTSTFTSTNITSIAITGSIASGIGIGSRFQLYKCVAEKVADITVGTATTSVNITGLNIDKTGEYMLVSDYNNTSTGTPYYLFCNANVTDTNYYTQTLCAYSTTIDRYRTNNAMFFQNTGSKKGGCFTNIKLTNSGYFIFQSNYLANYGSDGASCEAYSSYGTSTFTATSITSLTITSRDSNAIGIGSRFQLYKMK
jgi:hypothetical protein